MSRESDVVTEKFVVFIESRVAVRDTNLIFSRDKRTYFRIDHYNPELANIELQHWISKNYVMYF